MLCMLVLRLVKFRDSLKRGKMFEKEAKAVEFWRQKYMRQAIVVVLLLGGIAISAICFFEAFFTRLLCGAIAVALIYLMLKELYADLQTRGESVCMVQADDLFKDLRFDVGRGIEEKVLTNLQSVEEYQARECRNVVFQDGMQVEEDVFYNVVSAKFGQLNHVVFEGIIFEFELNKAISSVCGEAELINDKVNISGQKENLPQNPQIYAALQEVMKFFKSDKLKFESYEDKIYFLIPTREKIFWQFSLFRRNRVEQFNSRVLMLKAKAENLYAALNA